MYYTFGKMSSLKTLNLTGWDISNVTGGGLNSLFNFCTNFSGSAWLTNLFFNSITDFIYQTKDLIKINPINNIETKLIANTLEKSTFDIQTYTNFLKSINFKFLKSSLLHLFFH